MIQSHATFAERFLYNGNRKNPWMRHVKQRTTGTRSDKNYRAENNTISFHVESKQKSHRISEGNRECERKIGKKRDSESQQTEGTTATEYLRFVE